MVWPVPSMIWSADRGGDGFARETCWTRPFDKRMQPFSVMTDSPSKMRTLWMRVEDMAMEDRRAC